VSGVSVTGAPAEPAELLEAAARLLASPLRSGHDSEMEGHWPRTCALLTRLALESALDEYWGRALPSAAGCSMRAQLLLLPRFAGDEAAALARESWLGLSRAAHHHAYELAPTAGELREWHSAVRRLASMLAQKRIFHQRM
jgi:hypothetical protein